MPRLSPLPPDELSAEQRPLHEDMHGAVTGFFQGFTIEREDGALLGPFPPMLHFPEYGAAFWTFSKSLATNSALPRTVREIAILVTGTAYRARYELYAHERVAAQVGLSEQAVATIVAGQRPAELSVEEGAAYDVAAALQRGGALPGTVYEAAVAAFGERGTAELVYLVANYSAVSVLLNAYDTDVPDDAS